MNTIKDLIRVAHAAAVSRGEWKCNCERNHLPGVNPSPHWPSCPALSRSVAGLVNDLHEIVADAWREFRRGYLKLYYVVTDKSLGYDKFGDTPEARELACQGRCRPSGLWANVARLVIRLADIMGAYGWLATNGDHATFADIPLFVGTLSKWLATAYWFPIPTGAWSTETDLVSSAADTADLIVQTCLASATECGVDLWPIIAEVLAYEARGTA